MSMYEVEASLIQAAMDLNGIIPTAYENGQPFNKPSQSVWSEVFFLPNTPTVETLGGCGDDKTDGVLQIDYNYPLRTGTIAQRNQYEKVRNMFPAGKRLVYGGQVTTIISSGKSSGRIVDGWYRISMTINWYALIKRYQIFEDALPQCGRSEINLVLR